MDHLRLWDGLTEVFLEATLCLYFTYLSQEDKDLENDFILLKSTKMTEFSFYQQKHAFIFIFIFVILEFIKLLRQKTITNLMKDMNLQCKTQSGTFRRVIRKEKHQRRAITISTFGDNMSLVLYDSKYKIITDCLGLCTYIMVSEKQKNKFNQQSLSENSERILRRAINFQKNIRKMSIYVQQYE